MAIYNGNVKYNLADAEWPIGAEYVGDNLVWNSLRKVGDVIPASNVKVNHQHSMLYNIVFTFKGIKSDLSNVPTGLIVRFHEKTPVGGESGSTYPTTILTASNIKTFDKSTSTDEIFFFNTTSWKPSITSSFSKNSSTTTYKSLTVPLTQNKNVPLSIYTSGELVTPGINIMIDSGQSSTSVRLGDDGNGNFTLQTDNGQFGIGIDEASLIGFPILLIDSVEVY